MNAWSSLRAWLKIELILLLALCFQSGAQSSSGSSQVPDEQRPSTSDAEGSIAAAARSSKRPNGARAKKVFSDEEEAWSGPLPKLKMEGTENSDEILAAISAYQVNHTPEQTEKAVRLWYERYDEILRAAIENGMEMQSLRNTNSSNSYQLCSEGQNQDCRAHQIAAQRSAPNDQAQMQRNFNAESRIQQAFMRVRNALWMHNLRYPWFKVRTTNGIDSF